MDHAQAHRVQQTNAFTQNHMEASHGKRRRGSLSPMVILHVVHTILHVIPTLGHYPENDRRLCVADPPTDVAVTRTIANVPDNSPTRTISASVSPRQRQ
jgi:hypothetical protein